MMRDLAPLYAEDLVSEETKKIIEEHLLECDDCKKQYYIATKQIEGESTIIKERECNEIDYMKRIHAYQKRNIILGAIISFLLGCCMPVIRIGLPVVLGNGVAEYQFARLQAMWYILLFKMIAAGVVVCCTYLIINRMLKGKNTNEK